MWEWKELLESQEKAEKWDEHLELMIKSDSAFKIRQEQIGFQRSVKKLNESVIRQVRKLLEPDNFEIQTKQ